MSAMRTGRELMRACREFQKEDRRRSWFHVIETLGVIFALLPVLILAPWWWVRLPAAIVQGLVIVRGFIIYHDFMHNAILRGSKPARAILYTYGIWVLTPPRVWRQTHNYHHAHTAKIVGSHVGSYAMVTTDIWEAMNAQQRRMYKIVRHPMTILFGYFTIFLYGMCASSFMRNPRKNWDSLLAIVVNLTLTVGIWTLFGFQMFFFAYFLPLFVATASGAYLFYAQHNFPEIHVQRRDQWEFTRAALESSSYMEMNPVMAWFTGNIGYHHVHHLNATIPFYRLPEAMAAIPELQNPPTTSLTPKDIVSCFRQKLWDSELGRMVGYPKAA